MADITFSTHTPPGKTEPDFVVNVTGEGSRNSGTAVPLSELTPERLVQLIKQHAAPFTAEEIELRGNR